MNRKARRAAKSRHNAKSMIGEREVKQALDALIARGLVEAILCPDGETEYYLTAYGQSLDNASFDRLFKASTLN